MAEESNLVPQSKNAELVEPYPLLQPQSAEQTLAMIGENLGPQVFSILNLPRIKSPSGGSLSLRVDTAGGEESRREVEGLLASWRPARLYWKGRAGKKPPDCTSTNGFTGIGDPGGSCAQCPWSRFGTSTNPDGSQGGGQACKEIRQLLLVLPDEILPHLLSVPPTSVKAFTQYTLNLLSSRLLYWSVVTRISLEKATSENGTDYARMVFRPGRRLTLAEQRAFAPYHEKMKEILAPSAIDASAYEVVEGAGAQPEQIRVLDDDIPF